MTPFVILGGLTFAWLGVLSWRRAARRRMMAARGEARRATLDARWRGQVEGPTADRQRAA